jgi:hypothetical protein
MPKSATDWLVSDAPIVPVWGTPKVTKCSSCKKKFERYDDKWAYHFVKSGKDYWQCSWTCHRKEEARLYPKSQLRGEACAERRIYICGEKP